MSNPVGKIMDLTAHLVEQDVKHVKEFLFGPKEPEQTQTAIPPSHINLTSMLNQLKEAGNKDGPEMATSKIQSLQPEINPDKAWSAFKERAMTPSLSQSLEQGKVTSKLDDSPYLSGMRGALLSSFANAQNLKVDATISGLNCDALGQTKVRDLTVDQLNHLQQLENTGETTIQRHTGLGDTNITLRCAAPPPSGP